MEPTPDWGVVNNLGEASVPSETNTALEIISHDFKTLTFVCVTSGEGILPNM